MAVERTPAAVPGRMTAAGPAVATAATPPPAGAPATRSRWRLGTGGLHVLAAWLVSRLVAGTALVLGGSPSVDKLTFGWFNGWDGMWYQLIAGEWYDNYPHNSAGQTKWPFFPLFPALTRITKELGVPWRPSSVLAANLVAIVALAGVWTLASMHLSRRAAVLSVWFVALFPTSLTLVMGYPSSLYLAGAVWAFVFAERRQDLAAGVCAAVATMARPNGFVVPLALALAVWCREREEPLPVRARRAVAVGVPAGIAFAVWCALLWRWSGNPFIFFSAKNGWDEITIFEFLDQPGIHGVSRAAYPHLLAVGVAIVFLAAAWRQAWFRLEWKVLAVLSLVPSLVLGIVGIGRYAAECFPVALAAGSTLDRLPARRVTAPAFLVLCAAGLAYFGVLVARFRFVP